jgi:hypothetical protein
MADLDLSALGPAGIKLGNILGPREVAALVREAVQTLGRDGLDSPQKRYWFGAILVAKSSPVLRVMGRSIMAQAILHGARPDDPMPAGQETLASSST